MANLLDILLAFVASGALLAFASGVALCMNFFLWLR